MDVLLSTFCQPELSLAELKGSQFLKEDPHLVPKSQKLHIRTDLLVPWTENYLSSFKCGFLNIFSRQNLLRCLSRLLFLLRWNNYGAKKMSENHISFEFREDSTLANQGAGKTTEKSLKKLPWNQQDEIATSRNFARDFVSYFQVTSVLTS